MNISSRLIDSNITRACVRLSGFFRSPGALKGPWRCALGPSYEHSEAVGMING